MSLIELSPEPYIYSPPLTLFGGVKINDGYSKVISDLSRIIKGITDSIYQAYNIKTVINSGNYSLESVTKPVSAELILDCVDYSMSNKARQAVNKLLLCNKLQGILIDNPLQFYFIQLLTPNFMPELSKNLLIAVQETALTLVEKKHSVKGLVTNYCLATRSQLM